MFIYLIAFWRVGSRAGHEHRLSFVMPGARPTDVHFVALWTGARVGQQSHHGAPTGCYGMRLTYNALLLLPSASSRSRARSRDPRHADRAGAIIALVGAVGNADHLLLVTVVERAPGIS